MPRSTYQSYRGLPPLAGLATIEEAARPGLGIEACVARLKRYHYAFRRLHEIFTARITAEPIYELKTGLLPPRLPLRRARPGPPRPGRRDARAAARAWRPCPTRPWKSSSTRSSPRRRPPSCSSGSTRSPLPALDAALARHMAETNPLADAPSVRVCRFARLELADMIDFGRKAHRLPRRRRDAGGDAALGRRS